MNDEFVSLDPVVDPVEDLPASDPLEDFPAVDPVEDLPAVDPVEDLPAVDPVEDLSAVDPVEDLSAVDPVEDLSATDPVEDLPGYDSVDDLPGDSQLESYDPPVLGISDSGSAFDFFSSIGTDFHLTLSLDDSLQRDLFSDYSLANGDIVPYSMLDPIGPEDTSGLKSVLLSVLGPYESIVTEYRYQNSSSSSYSYLRQVSPDYPWLMSAALFIVLIISVFRIAGGFLWKR